MPKYINDNNKYNNMGKDEIVARCSCGCSFLSFSIRNDLSITVDQKQEIHPILSIIFYTIPWFARGKMKSAVMDFYDTDSIVRLLGVLNKTLANGNGAIASADDSLLAIFRNEEENSVGLTGFDSVKDFIKFNKSGKDKYISWAITLYEKEFETLKTALTKMIAQNFKIMLDEQKEIDKKEVFQNEEINEK